MLILVSSTSLAFFAIGIIAMFSHALKKWAYNEIRGNLIDWYVMHPKATTSAILATLGGIAGGILSGMFTDLSVGSEIIAAFGIGYASDTLNNQGKK